MCFLQRAVGRPIHLPTKSGHLSHFHYQCSGLQLSSLAWPSAVVSHLFSSLLTTYPKAREIFPKIKSDQIPVFQYSTIYAHPYNVHCVPTALRTEIQSLHISALGLHKSRTFLSSISLTPSCKGLTHLLPLWVNPHLSIITFWRKVSLIGLVSC